jgi:hypothetical protein
MSADPAEMGPIDYVIVEFPGTGMNGEGLPMLVDLVERGVIRILDLLFVTKRADGSVAAVDIADFDGDGRLDLAVFEGAGSGLIGDDDIAQAGAFLEPGSRAGILVYENRWAAPFVSALRRNGARLVSSGRIQYEALVETLETTEARG